MAEQLIFGPALAMGIILGIYEINVIHRDVQVGKHHYLHAIGLTIVFVFAVMNVNFLLSVIPQLRSIPVISNEHAFRALIGLIAAAKIHGAAAGLGSGGGGISGTGETWFHSLFVGGLIAGSHYAYPLLEPLLPSWFKW